MATEKSTRARSSTPKQSIAEARHEAHRLHLDLFDQLETLRLVYRTIDHVEDHSEPDGDLSAARGQLGRLVEDLDAIHTRVDVLSGMLSRLDPKWRRETERMMRKARPA